MLSSSFRIDRRNSQFQNRTKIFIHHSDRKHYNFIFNILKNQTVKEIHEFEIFNFVLLFLIFVFAFIFTNYEENFFKESFWVFLCRFYREIGVERTVIQKRTINGGKIIVQCLLFIVFRGEDFLLSFCVWFLMSFFKDLRKSCATSIRFMWKNLSKCLTEGSDHGAAGKHDSKWRFV